MAGELSKFEQPKMQCPKCEAEYDDFDGLGVLYCEQCGYCRHAATGNGACCYCGELMG